MVNCSCRLDHREEKLIGQVVGPFKKTRFKSRRLRCGKGLWRIAPGMFTSLRMMDSLKF